MNLKIKWRPRTVGLPAVLGATGLDPSDDDGHPPLDPAGFAPAARSFRAEHHAGHLAGNTKPPGQGASENDARQNTGGRRSTGLEHRAVASYLSRPRAGLLCCSLSSSWCGSPACGPDPAFWITIPKTRVLFGPRVSPLWSPLNSTPDAYESAPGRIRPHLPLPPVEVCGDTWSTGPSGGLLPTAEELAKTPEKRPPQELAKEAGRPPMWEVWSLRFKAAGLSEPSQASNTPCESRGVGRISTLAGKKFW